MFEWMSLVGFIVWMYYLISWWVYVMVYFHAWCYGECFVGNMKFSCVACWECFALLESSWWNLMKNLDECDAMFGLVWLFGFGVCVFKPRMHCDHKVSMLIECDVEYYWIGFIYEFLLWISLFMVSLPPICLFVSLLYVRWSYNVCII